MSIMSDRSTPSNGGKWDLICYVQWVSSHLPPLDVIDPSDMIDIGNIKNYHSHKLFIRLLLQKSNLFPVTVSNY